MSRPGAADYIQRLPPDAEPVIERETGVRLNATPESVPEPDEKGVRTVMCTLNRQMRPVSVRNSHLQRDAKADPSG